jgi:hypothetical protein
MARGLVAVIPSLALLAICAACTRLTTAPAATRTPPGSAVGAAEVAATTQPKAPWRVAPVTLAPAARAIAARKPSELNPRPAARQGSSAPPPAETRFGSGDGVNLDPLGTCISCTNASAGSNSSASESRELKVADESIAEGQGPTNGYNYGSAFSLPPNSLLSAALGYFQMDNRADRNTSEAHSSGTLADVRLGDGQMANLAILESRSNASYSAASGAHRDGTSSGMRANLDGGTMAVVLLHSESSSEGSGRVYLLHINDRDVASAEQLGGGPPLDVPRVATVRLFRTGPDGAVVGAVQDGSSNQAAGIVATSANSSGDQH